MLKQDDHAMTWYDHGDSYLTFYGHAMAIVEDSVNIS